MISHESTDRGDTPDHREAISWGVVCVVMMILAAISALVLIWASEIQEYAGKAPKAAPPSTTPLAAHDAPIAVPVLASGTRPLHHGLQRARMLPSSPQFPAVPPWAYGVSLSDGQALYQAWSRFAESQGPDDGPAMGLMRYLAAQPRADVTDQILWAASSAGDWRVLGAALTEHMIAVTGPADEPPVRALLANCQAISSQCLLAGNVLMISPKAFDRMWNLAAEQMQECGVPRSVTAMQRLLLLLDPTPFSQAVPWCLQ